eukprot:2779919-Amphidinium_carterae.1
MSKLTQLKCKQNNTYIDKSEPVRVIAKQFVVQGLCGVFHRHREGKATPIAVPKERLETIEELIEHNHYLDRAMFNLCGAACFRWWEIPLSTIRMKSSPAAAIS